MIPSTESFFFSHYDHLKNLTEASSAFLGKTNYRLAFEKAFQLLKETASENTDKQVSKVILFLTDGAPSDEKRAIFQTIRDKSGAQQLRGHIKVWIRWCRSGNN